MTASGRFRALLIGNWEYTDPDMKLRVLNGPRNDVEVLGAALEHGEFGLFQGNVTTRSNLRSGQISDEAYQFIDEATPDDRLLIYYSGHGERLTREQRLGFCGVDVQYSRRESQCFDSRRLLEWLEQHNRAASTVIILDCCYAGQFKGVEDERTITASFGTGTMVLSSGGNEVVEDAQATAEASPFTAALAHILTDPDLGADDGSLTADAVYDALTRARLPTAPKRNVEARGRIPLARRPAAPAPPEPESVLPGWRDDLVFTSVDVRFEADRIVADWGAGSAERSLSSFDGNRRAALRRLGQLVDVVMRLPEYQSESRLVHVVRRALACIGSNLFEDALPEGLQARVIEEFARERQHVLRLRLSFSDAASETARYPWEYIQRAPESGPSGPFEPLGLNNQLVVERCLGPADERAPDGGAGRPSVAVVNALPPPYHRAGERLGRELVALKGVDLLADLQGDDARWQNFTDRMDLIRPQYLVLHLPIQRLDGQVGIGFPYNTGKPDWRTVRNVADELRHVGGGIVLVTVAATPGSDCFRGVTQAAHELSLALRRPVFFVCHQPGFETFYDQPFGERPATMWGLMFDALGHGKSLDESYCYARNQVVRQIPQESRTSIGVPGCYLPASAAPVGAGGGGVVGSRGTGPLSSTDRSKA